MNINKNELTSALLIRIKEVWNDSDEACDFIAALLSRMSKDNVVDMDRVILKLREITSQIQTAQYEVEFIKATKNLGR